MPPEAAMACVLLGVFVFCAILRGIKSRKKRLRTVQKQLMGRLACDKRMLRTEKEDKWLLSAKFGRTLLQKGRNTLHKVHGNKVFPLIISLLCESCFEPEVLCATKI